MDGRSFYSSKGNLCSSFVLCIFRVVFSKIFHYAFQKQDNCPEMECRSQIVHHTMYLAADYSKLDYTATATATT